VKVIFEGVFYGGLVREEGLDINGSFFYGAARPACYVGDKLEGPFVCPEIGQVQACIGAYDTDEGDIREVQALCEYLGAGEDIDTPQVEVLKDSIIVFRGDGVTVESGDICIAEFGAQLLFESL